MSDLKVAASTFPFLYSMSGIDALKHLHGMGYRAFEMMIFPPHCWPPELTAAQRREIKDFMEGEGLVFSSFCYPALDNNPNSVDKIMRDYTLDRYKEAFDLAAEWNCPYVVAIPGPVNSLINPPYDWMRKWFVEAMQELLEHSKGMDVQLLLENVPFTFLPTWQDMVGVAREIGPDVAINYDICNAAYIKEDVGAAIREMGDMVRNVHMSDSGYEEFKHDRLGTGIVDPAPAAAALKEIGYDGYTVLEIITDANQPDADPDGDIRASQEIVERHGWARL